MNQSEKTVSRYYVQPKKNGPKVKSKRVKKVPHSFSLEIWFSDLLLALDKEVKDAWDKQNNSNWLIKSLKRPKANASKEIMFRYLCYDELVKLVKEIISTLPIAERAPFEKRIPISPNAQYLNLLDEEEIIPD